MRWRLIEGAIIVLTAAVVAYTFWTAGLTPWTVLYVALSLAGGYLAADLAWRAWHP